MDKLLVVDGNSVLYRGFYALPLLTTKEGLYTNAVYGFCNIFIKALKDVQPTHVVVAFDYGKKTFRNELFSEYKITRKETPSELIAQFPIIKEVLKSMNIKYIEMEGYEGDDILGSISKKFKDIETIILTGDRDTLQLIDDTTKIYLTKKGITDVKVYDEEVLLEEKGITPKQVIDVKAIMGDVSDNIPGVKGIGKKGAYSLITKFGTLQDLYNNLDSLSAGQKTKLIESKDSAFLSLQLGTIKTDLNIDYDLTDFSFKLPFPYSFYLSCKKYDFVSMLKNKELFESEPANHDEITQLIVNDTKKANSILEKLENCKNIALDFRGGFFEIAITSNEVVKFEFNLEQISSLFKNLFENKNIRKYVFDLKSLKKMFKQNGIECDFEAFDDVALMYYLLTANDKVIEEEDFCDRFSASKLSIAILNSIEYLESELKNNNLKSLYNDIELPLVEVLCEMEINGIKIDKEKLIKLNERTKREIAKVTNEIYLILGYEINLNSPKQLAEALFDDLKIFVPDNKKRSTSVEVLQKVEHIRIVNLLLKYRKLVKLQTSYLESYLNCEKEGYIHSHFLQMVTGTGRLSSKEPNLQNIPIQDSDSKSVREIFISRFEDGNLISFDYDQIELKLMAHFSGDETMVQAFKSNQDIHQTVASKICRVPLEEVTSEQRRRAKAVNFGIIYGQSAYGLANALNVTVKYAQEFIENYFETFPKVKDYMDSSVEKVKQNDYIARTILGRIRKLPEMKSSQYQLRTFGERVAINMPLQGSASDIIKLAMVRIFNKMQEQKFKSKLILQVHDELVFDVEPSEEGQLTQLVKEEMENVIDISIPLTVSIQKNRTLNKD